MTRETGPDPSAEFVAQATALYALPLDRFVSARNAAAAEAKRDGDKELAASLKALPKPASAAWLVNMLVQRRRAEVEQVLELGASLKEAQAGMDRAQLHALGQQRQRLLAAVAQESLAAGSEAGYDIGAAALPGVEQTLRAALADPAAAAAVLTGRLVRTLEASGWDAVDLEDAVGGPFENSPDAEPGAARADADDPRSAARTTRRRKQAEAVLAAARRSREDAESAASETRRDAEQNRVRREDLTWSIAEVEQQLEALRRDLAELESTHAALETQAREAADELTEAREDEDAALADLEEFGKST